MTLWHVLRFARPYRLGLAFAAAFQLLQVAATLAIPWLGGQMAETLLGQTVASLTPVALGLVAVFALRGGLTYAGSRAMSAVFEDMIATLRKRLYTHLQSLPLVYFNAHRPGDHMAVLTKDADDITSFVTDDVLGVLPAALTLIGGAAMMLRLEPSLALPMLLGLPCVVLLGKLLTRRLRPMSRDTRDAYGSAVSVAEDNLAVLPAIKAFAREPQEAARYGAQVETLKTLGLRLARQHALITPLMQFVVASAVVGLLWLSSDRLGSGDLAPGELVSLFLYATFMAPPIGRLAAFWGRSEAVGGALERMQAVLQETGEDFDAGLRLGAVKGKITVQGLGFCHAGRSDGLVDVSLTVPAGKILALTGENGAGKSTLVDLILRFHDPDAGRILLDGVDLQDINLHDLRQAIGLVPQRSYLMDASLRENIRFGRPDASDAEITQAAQLAQADEFIRALPDGYDTLIGSRGVRLSGGQRQRIALARAMVKAPPILILDEPTAMFDPSAEAEFVRDARHALDGRTVILITHRPASLELADITVRLEGGRIVPDGSGKATQ